MDSPAVAALAGSGGVAVGALAAWRKSGPESESIAITTLKAVIQELRLELDRKEVEIGTMRSRLDVLDRHLSVMADDPPGHLS